jgi:SAM-dependent methyltransferase
MINSWDTTMVIKTCPLCGSTKYDVVAEYGEIGSAQYDCKFVRCSNCDHYFTIISNEINFEDCYGSGQYSVIDTRNSAFDKILFFDDLLIIKTISKLKFLEKKSLLDFGCGKGRFIYNASRYGWKVKGIETAEKRAEYGANIYGLDISTCEYFKGKIDGGPFSVITILHVLEHLSKPKAILKELLANNLYENGLMVIEVPLFGSLQSKIAGKQWLHLDPPHHLSHFTKCRLFALLDELRLVPIHYEYFSISLGILGMIQSLMNFLGYKKMIISELKFKRTKRLMLSILFALPISFFLEISANLFSNGGIIRVYCKKII